MIITRPSKWREGCWAPPCRTATASAAPTRVQGDTGGLRSAGGCSTKTAGTPPTTRVRGAGACPRRWRFWWARSTMGPIWRDDLLGLMVGNGHLSRARHRPGPAIPGENVHGVWGAPCALPSPMPARTWVPCAPMPFPTPAPATAHQQNRRGQALHHLRGATTNRNIIHLVLARSRAVGWHQGGSLFIDPRFL